ncbi:MAG: hypothetical protein WDA22_02930 [Bacteroidota bacterium]
MKRTKKLPITHYPLSILFFILFSFTLHAQSITEDTVWLNDDWYYSAEDSSFIDLTDFLPTFFNDEAHLKRYLRNKRFIELRKLYDDTLAVDAIYDRAMLIADGDVRHALLIATLAVMDHRTLGINVPLFGSIYFPLTFENDSLFRLRRTNLPKKLLNDKQRSSDKDKLQHFFGSAFLAYSTNSHVISEWIGDLLEIGENRFVLGGKNDPRDKLANAKGREFGLRLLRDEQLLPSDILWGE